MSLREMVLRFKRYGMLLVLILVATFVMGLFPLARRINSYYSTSYVSLLKGFLNELLDQASSQSQSPFNAVVRRLNRHVDSVSNIDLSNLLRYEKLPWVSSDLRGIFVHGNSVKFLLERESEILLVEVPVSLFERTISADMAYVFLTSSEGIVVVCNRLDLLGSKLNTNKGFLRINGLVGFVHSEPLEGFDAFVGSFIPFGTYLIVLLPYIIVALAALCGAVFWLNFAYSFENRLITAVNAVLDNVNQSLAKLEKTDEVVFVPLETKISELNQLQDGIHRLVEAQKASWHELHAMT